MLESLFTETEGENSLKKTSLNSRKIPLEKRKNTNLSGIVNQGATCYLNTLLQTLFLTKEFRGTFLTLT